MKNIVLPIDFSETTNVLVEATIQFAKEINGKIYIIHVDATHEIVVDMSFEYSPEKEQQQESEELLQLRNLTEQVINTGIECEYILKQGHPGTTVLEYAKEKDAAYIVMGSHGRSGFYDVFIGSLTKELTRRSPFPVLVIPCHPGA